LNVITAPSFGRGDKVGEGSDSGGFPRGELTRIVMMVQEHAVDLQRSWDDDVAD
jgi:hypothetical protein